MNHKQKRLQELERLMTKLGNEYMALSDPYKFLEMVGRVIDSEP